MVAQAVEKAGLFHAVGQSDGVCINGVTILGQFLGLLRHSQHAAQHTVGIAGGCQSGCNMDKRNAGLLLQGIQIFGSRFFGLAHIDHHFGTAGKQRFEIQLALAAIKLAKLGQAGVFFVQIRFGSFIPGVGNAHKLIRAKSKQIDLCQGSRNRHLLNIGGQCDGAAQRIGEFLCGGSFRCTDCGRGSVGRRSGRRRTAGTQRKQQGNSHQGRKYFFHEVSFYKQVYLYRKSGIFLLSRTIIPTGPQKGI